jgi:hypothetical protein
MVVGAVEEQTFQSVKTAGAFGIITEQWILGRIPYLFVSHD